MTTVIVYSMQKLRSFFVFVQYSNKKRTYLVVRILTFNEKNSLYLSLIVRLQLFEGQSHQGGTKLVIKPFAYLNC